MNRINLLVALMLTLFFQVKSQDILPAERMDMILEVSANDTATSTSDTTFSINSKVISKVIIVLQDTIHLSKIHVMLGSTPNSQNLLSKYFTYNTSGVFADGTSFSRTGNIVYLQLGTRIGIQNYYAEVKLEDTYGRFTEPVKLSGN